MKVNLRGCLQWCLQEITEKDCTNSTLLGLLGRLSYLIGLVIRPQVDGSMMMERLLAPTLAPYEGRTQHFVRKKLKLIEL